MRRLHHSNHSVGAGECFSRGAVLLPARGDKPAMDDKLPLPDQSPCSTPMAKSSWNVFAADSINSTPYDHRYVVNIMKEDLSAAASPPGRRTWIWLGATTCSPTRNWPRTGLSFALDEPVVLFRGTNHGAPQSPADPSAEPGIIIWIEQAAPSPTQLTI